MPENSNPESTSFSDSGNFPTPVPSVEDILKNPQSGIVTIREFVETARTAAVGAAESQRQTVAALTDAQAKLTEITTAATQAVAAKTKITDDQTVIATKSAHIQAAQEHADKVRADLDRALTEAKQQATEAEGLKSRTQSAADNSATLLADLRAAKGSVETDAAAIVAARKSSEDYSELTKDLAVKSGTIETRIAAYEKRLAELDTLCTTQLKLIEDLLPGATAAGLASSWDERRKTFLNPHKWWQILFIGSVVAIVGLALWSFWHVYSAGTPPTYDELLRLWLSRLPVAGALVWLALHASHESALAKRLEEDYGYKATVASCLMGFQKQISEVGKDAGSNASLAKLLDNTLTAIAAPPGRIYDSHKLTVAPSDELKEAAKAAVDVAGAAKPGGK